MTNTPPEEEPVASAETLKEMYCHQCCMYRPVRQESKAYRCTACNTVLQPPADPEACPRSPDGQHNPYRDNGRWACSQCNAPVPEPDDLVTLGGIR
jgi:hypothetical protein